MSAKEQARAARLRGRAANTVPVTVDCAGQTDLFELLAEPTASTLTSPDAPTEESL